MKANKLIIFLILSPFVITQNLFCQVGINTEAIDSSTELTILSSGSINPIVRVSNTSNKDIFVIKDNGYVGVGEGVDPKVRLDLRGGANEGAIAIGTSALTAIDAGEGAVRYNPTEAILEYSDGDDWVSVKEETVKANVEAIADTDKMSVVVAADAPLTNWTETRDVTSSFDASTGIFTAPNDGIYTVNANLLISSTNTLLDGSCELNIFYTSKGYTRGIKSVFPIISPTTNIDIPLANKSSVYLEKGDTIHLSFYFYKITNPVISNKEGNSSLNTLYIVQL